MKPFQTKGDVKIKRKRKRKILETPVEVKQEVIVKQESIDNIETVDIVRPRQLSPSTNATHAISLNHQNDDELYFANVKIECKDEGECLKKGCNSTQDGGWNGNGDLGNEPIGENSGNPEASASNKGGKKKRKIENKMLSDRKKKSNDRKKTTNAEASKMATVKRQRKHHCHLCSYYTRYTTQLTAHIRVHTGEKPFVCTLCMKSFSQRVHLLRHEKIHRSELKFSCSKCAQRFAEEIDKTDHETKCQGRRYECYACKFNADNSTDHRRHMQTNTGLKSVRCSVCSKRFSTKAHLQNHSRTHAKQLSFACPKCGRRFADPDKKQSHEKRCKCRRYDCYLCQYECFGKSMLQYHMRAKHTGERPFECQFCDVRSFNRSCANKHMERVHRQKK